MKRSLDFMFIDRTCSHIFKETLLGYTKSYFAVQEIKLLYHFWSSFRTVLILWQTWYNYLWWNTWSTAVSQSDLSYRLLFLFILINVALEISNAISMLKFRNFLSLKSCSLDKIKTALCRYVSDLVICFIDLHNTVFSVSLSTFRKCASDSKVFLLESILNSMLSSASNLT